LKVLIVTINRNSWGRPRSTYEQDAVLWQRGPRDAPVNFGTYQSLQAAASRDFHCGSNTFESNNSINLSSILLHIGVLYGQLHWRQQTVCKFYQ